MFKDTRSTVLVLQAHRSSGPLSSNWSSPTATRPPNWSLHRPPPVGPAPPPWSARRPCPPRECPSRRKSRAPSRWWFPRASSRPSRVTPTWPVGPRAAAPVEAAGWAGPPRASGWAPRGTTSQGPANSPARGPASW